MDENKLKQLAVQFAQELRSSKDLQDHIADHQRRSQRAQDMLSAKRLPKLTEQDLRDLFYDTDAFGFWTKKDWEFQHRIEKSGVGGLRDALWELVERGDQGLTAKELGRIKAMGGLGMLLASEMLAYRFPGRYWTYSANVTLPALKYLGDDLKATMSRGQKSDHYLYLAVGKRFDPIKAALSTAGVPDVDNLVVDLFLYWINTAQFVDKPKLAPEADSAVIEQAQKVIETLLPDMEIRKACLNLLADYILAAHSIQPKAWEITLYRNVVRLNVGRCRTFDIAGRCCVVIDPSVFSKGELAILEKHAQTRNENFKDVPDSLSIWFSPAELSGIMPIVQKAYQGFVKKAAQAHRGSPWRKAHSPAVTAYLQNLLGREIPDPIYVEEESDEKSETDKESRAWLFQANPKYFDLAASLEDACVGDPDGWIVSRYREEMRAGDPVILWSSGKDAGVYALGELTDAPCQRDQEPTQDELEERPYLKSEWWVPYRYTRILRKPILRGSLLDHPILRNLQILKVAQASNFRVTQEQWEALEELINQVDPTLDINTLLKRTFVERGFHFNDWQLATFYTALQTKGFVILSGISGTGKTKLAQEFAALLPQEGPAPNHLFVSVRPDWRDSKSLLGYYNPLTKTYEGTDFLRLLVRAAENYCSAQPVAWFVILDEMNLAHVEYYLADLLSVLESGRDDEGFTREALRLPCPDGATDAPPQDLHLSPNLYLVGTVNIDETTHAFSPKVLDRAFTLELTEADFSAYPPDPAAEVQGPGDDERQALLEEFGNGGTFARIEKRAIAEYVAEHLEVRERLQRLNNLLRPADLHFGYRVFDEIVSFLAHAAHNSLYDDALGGAEAAFDAAVLMKVLPKFHGSRGKLEKPLQELLAWCLSPDAPDKDSIEQKLKGSEGEQPGALDALADGTACPRTAARVCRLLRTLQETGFAAFA